MFPLPERLRAGTGRVDITPPVGSGLIGYLHPRISTGIRDRLYATSIFLSSDGFQLALVSCDLIALPRLWVDEAKGVIRRQSGLGREQVMVACTHTHTGPCTTSIFSSEADLEYLSGLPELIAKSVANACDTAEPAESAVWTGQEDSLVFNRRYRMTDGSVRTNPGVGNPQVLGPAGPIDPAIFALIVRGLKGRNIGAIFNYSNHVDVIGGCLISSDYPGIMARLYRDRFGSHSNLVYLNGACGDVNHINVKGTANQSGAEASERMAKVMFEDLQRGIAEVKRWERPELGAVLVPVRLPLRRIDQDDVRRAMEVLSLPDRRDSNAVFARELLLMARFPSDHVETVLQCTRVGNSALVGLPGETFVQIGLDIKAKSPFSPTAVVELANDYVGYLLTENAFREGGYETMPARSSWVAPGAAAVLHTKALEMLRLLRGSQLPGVP